uniref:Uncharacterized protein n=1 Tax=Anguilla anguilla TaxID=7936 RepID=A0A0E9TZ98_ANGAN
MPCRRNPEVGAVP